MTSQRLTGLCSLDLSSAFDTIDHTVLIERLSSWFNIGGTALSWLSSFLLNRTFSVKVGDNLSEPRDLLYGVPQGSVLGPILFSLYTTPLSTVIASQAIGHHFFADDTQSFDSFTPSGALNHLTTVQNTFKSVSSWMNANFLALNPSKTEYIVFGTPQQLAKLQNHHLILPSGDVIKTASIVRNLGSYFDKHMTMHDQITRVSQACFYHIRDLRCIRPYLDSKTAAIIGTALVQSQLDNCNALYLNLPANELERLQKVQNALARAVLRISKFTHVTPALKSLHWLRVRERIKYKVLSLTYKCITTSKPSYLSELIAVQAPGVTRSSKLLTLRKRTVPSNRTLWNRSFRHAVPIMWNDLPDHLRALDASFRPALSHTQFHKQLKTYLFDLSYPSASCDGGRPTRKPPDP